jgi:sRNA-binding carbon storage regulator CsrA
MVRTCALEDIKEATSMLALNRYRGESIMIGSGDYCVTVRSFDASHIVVDIEALRGSKAKRRVTLQNKKSTTIGDYVIMYARLSPDDDRVILSFDAPKSIVIDRMELYLDKQRRYQETAESSSTA